MRTTLALRYTRSLGGAAPYTTSSSTPAIPKTSLPSTSSPAPRSRGPESELSRVSAFRHRQHVFHSLPLPPKPMTVQDLKDLKVGFIGGGAMGAAIAEGLLAKGLSPKSLTIGEVSKKVRNQLAKRMEDVNLTDDPVEVVENADVIFLCVKPNVTGKVLGTIAPHLKTNKHTIVSVAAGVNMETLMSQAGVKGLRMVRSMPNTGCLVGASATTIFPNESCRQYDIDVVVTLFSVSGITVPVTDENLLDAATGVAGSGIAYVYLFIEALADGAVYAGLPRPMAMKLAAQTVLGGAKMVLKDGNPHPGALKDLVCSPGGTTIAAVRELERGGLRHTVMSAVIASAEKSQELGHKATV